VARNEGSGWFVRDVLRARIGYWDRRESVVWWMSVDSDGVGGDVCVCLISFMQDVKGKGG
jgi:hypothetical protein